jgi:DNA (cytosine-5)-methyltransferase 1
MISILGDYSYTFPNPIPLKLKLKDMLEDEVDEKYYLSNKQLNDISNWNAYEKPLEHIDDEIVGTLTTRSGAYCSSMKLVGTYQYAKSDNFMKGKDRLQLGKEVSDTLQTTQKEGVVILGNYSKSNHNASRIVDQEHSASTVMENHGTITAIVRNINKNAKHQQDFIQETNGNCRTLVSGTHGNGGHYTKTLMDDLRIRKLTPKECFRLMGVKDEDYERIAQNQSDSSLYHLAGDSIVVDVLMAIFKELLGGD